MLYYGYRVPPMYDERLSQNVLDWLQTAPILLIVFGYWMASNQQLLSNDHLKPVADTNDTADSDHLMFFMFDSRGWWGFYWTMIISFFVLLIIKFCGNWISKKLEACFPSLAIGDIDLDEDIANYWAVLDDHDRKWSQREEHNNRANLNLPLLTEEMYDMMENTTKTKGKTLQGVHSYDILANPLYFDDYQYVTAAEDDRNEMIIDDDADESNDAAQSDFVRVALNLAYLTEKQAKSIKFNERPIDVLKKKDVKLELNHSQRNNHF